MRLFVLLTILSISPLRAESLRADGPYFRDEKGAVVLLRGVNVSPGMKTPPFTEKLKASDLKPLPEWGVNTVRMLFIWEAFEPKKGEYDQKYMDWFAAMVKEATDRGMKVVVDFHQDAFSRYDLNGCGSGFPKWAVSGEAANPDNGKPCSGWGDMQLLDEHYKQSFRDFYNNKNDARDHYLHVMEILAAKFKDNHDVIGFDLMNEPWGEWHSKLLPLYTDVHDRFHQIAPEKILFLEPSLGRVSLYPPSTMLGVPVPGLKVDPEMEKEKPAFDNFAFAPHYYDLLMLAKGVHVPANAETGIEEIDAIGKKWNSPVWIGEFSGLFHTHDQERLDKSNAYVENLYRQFNKRFMSAAQWGYTPTWDPENLDGWNRENVSIVDDKGKFWSFRVRPAAENCRRSGRDDGRLRKGSLYLGLE